MPNTAYSPQHLREVAELAAKLIATNEFYYKDRVSPGQKSVKQEIARQLSVSSSSVRALFEGIEERLGVSVTALAEQHRKPTEDDLEVLPDGEAVMDKVMGANTGYIEAMRRRRIRIIPVRPEPFALAFLGDPHLDNKGTDLSLLKRDMGLLRATRTRAINIGDLLDNFHHTGKLAKKQAANRVSASEAMGMARWFVRDSGVKFDAHILGNHDHWPGDAYGTMLQQWAQESGSRLYDWMVRLVYQWDGGSFSVLAAHDFKGNSIHNPLHGLFRRAMEDGQDDLYVAGHRHTAAQAGFENGFRERRYEFLRVKGYKAWDDYAYVKGFPQQTEGASALAVIDPLAPTKSGRCRTFFDIEEGLEFLSLVKQRYAVDE